MASHCTVTLTLHLEKETLPVERGGLRGRNRRFFREMKLLGLLLKQGVPTIVRFSILVESTALGCDCWMVGGGGLSVLVHEI